MGKTWVSEWVSETTFLLPYTHCLHRNDRSNVKVNVSHKPFDVTSHKLPTFTLHHHSDHSAKQRSSPWCVGVSEWVCEWVCEWVSEWVMSEFVRMMYEVWINKCDEWVMSDWASEWDCSTSHHHSDHSAKQIEEPRCWSARIGVDHSMVSGSNKWIMNVVRVRRSEWMSAWVSAWVRV
jgi:hypothetical protein